ncbi:MAG: hypothetical protein ABH834_03330 [Candidatus Altiarchaeota archaeon]
MSMRHKTKNVKQAPDEGDQLNRRAALARMLRGAGAAAAFTAGTGLLDVGPGTSQAFAQQVKSEEEALRLLYPDRYRHEAALKYRKDGLQKTAYRVPMGGTLIVHNQGDTEDRVILENGIGFGTLTPNNRFEVYGRLKCTGVHKAPTPPEGVRDQIIPLGNEFRTRPLQNARWWTLHARKPDQIKVTVLDSEGKPVENPTPNPQELRETRQKTFNAIKEKGVPAVNEKFKKFDAGIMVNDVEQAFYVFGLEKNGINEPRTRLIVTDDGDALLQWDPRGNGRFEDLPLERPSNYPRISATLLSSALNEAKEPREKFINPPTQKRR